MTYPNYSEEELRNNERMDDTVSYIILPAVLIGLVILGFYLVRQFRNEQIEIRMNSGTVEINGEIDYLTCCSDENVPEAEKGKRSFTIEPNKQHTFDNPDGQMASCYDEHGNLWLTGSGQSKVTVDVKLTCYY